MDRGASLVERAKAGDVRAFEELVETHLGSVRRFARAFGRSPEDTDDIAQEALVKAFRSIRGYRSESSFTTWLFSIVRNCLIDASRSRQGHERAAEQPLERQHLESTDHTDAPDEKLAREQTRRRVWRALSQLPADMRATLVLFDIEGMSLEEVSAVEGVPVGTVKSRISRGRTRLRELLGGEREPGDAPSRAPGNLVSA